MRNRRTYIVPVGGLGNQLFQYVAGLSLSGHGELVLDLSFGNMRVGREGLSPLERLKLNTSVTVLKVAGRFEINKRIYLYLLRVSTNPTKLESSIVWRGILTLLASAYFSIIFRDFIKVVLSSGLGYSEPTRSKMNCLYVGYFQSYKYLEKVSRDFHLEPLKESKALKSLISSSIGVSVLMIHIRLGDYLLEKKFGNLQSSYYSRAFEFHSLAMSYDEVWVFSEDTAGAQELLPRQLTSKSRYFQDIDGDEIYSLLAMARADGFIIANSSFSWWAASLSESASKLVTVPNPWFRELNSPKEMCPTSWHKIEAY